eukprot:CAMPEP_0118658136 /NCGR_PEP_ID=MMETSP0785-20121206/14400_1 /TAXON_ID=91992 /ORGANISM="Bolidomonas pacifica, Strain CCMP 1866" /LENGTH=188 /DNA_ID=CAMNT_0006551119 /DNA_START=55 /DNA_END=617 /DNA_ORIENTATION=+
MSPPLPYFLSSFPAVPLACGLFVIVVTTVLIYHRTRIPTLSSAYASFPVISRRVINGGDRPIIALTVKVATGTLPTMSHVKIRKDGVEKSYTPTRFDGGVCELMIRVYPDGVLTPKLFKVGVGDKLSIKGPTGLHRYEGPGTFKNGRKRISGVKKIGMISGGTGVTPMMQVINHIIRDEKDSTKVGLL